MSELWTLEVLCDCINARKPHFIGECLAQNTRALGLRMTLRGGSGLGSAHPFALFRDYAKMSVLRALHLAVRHVLQCVPMECTNHYAYGICCSPIPAMRAEPGMFPAPTGASTQSKGEGESVH